jgi:hypothetical protein
MSKRPYTVTSTHPETEYRSISVGTAPVSGHPVGIFTGYDADEETTVATPWIALTPSQARELAAALIEAADRTYEPPTITDDPPDGARRLAGL